MDYNVNEDDSENDGYQCSVNEDDSQDDGLQCSVNEYDSENGGYQCSVNENDSQDDGLQSSVNEDGSDIIDDDLTAHLPFSHKSVPLGVVYFLSGAKAFNFLLNLGHFLSSSSSS